MLGNWGDKDGLSVNLAKVAVVRRCNLGGICAVVLKCVLDREINWSLYLDRIVNNVEKDINILGTMQTCDMDVSISCTSLLSGVTVFGAEVRQKMKLKDLEAILAVRRSA
ncbi:hypothetical protein J6590_035262 [Homalodisca vitripennis]|nr:hypothetical protein J6590_035262 [Homalodisca vitripennis]